MRVLLLLGMLASLPPGANQRPSAARAGAARAPVLVARTTRKKKSAPKPAAPTPAPEANENAAEPAPGDTAAPPAPTSASAAPILDDKPAAAADAKPAPPVAAPAPEPAAKEAPPVRAAPDINQLRAEYDELRDAVFRSRARRETLEQALFSTKITPVLRWEANRHYVLKRAEVRLDGTRLWDSGDKPVGEDPVPLATRAVAPGAHVLGLRIEVRSRDNAKLGYVSDHSFSLTLPEAKETKLTIDVDEDGNAPAFEPQIELDLDN